jgi:uncharacterized membrane protein YjjP (DUF1212 family)
LEDDAIEYIEDVERLLDRDTDLAKLVAYQRVSALVESGRVNRKTIRDAGRAIEEDLETFERLVAGSPEKDTVKGEEAA